MSKQQIFFYSDYKLDMDFLVDWLEVPEKQIISVVYKTSIWRNLFCLFKYKVFVIIKEGNN